MNRHEISFHVTTSALKVQVRVTYTLVLYINTQFNHILYSSKNRLISKIVNLYEFSKKLIFIYITTIEYAQIRVDNRKKKFTQLL